MKHATEMKELTKKYWDNLSKQADEQARLICENKISAAIQEAAEQGKTTIAYTIGSEHYSIKGRIMNLLKANGYAVSPAEGGNMYIFWQGVAE